MDNIATSHYSEKCGDWIVSFDWPAHDGYKKDVSHVDSESDNTKTFADTLAMTSISDSNKSIKITITKYSAVDDSLMTSSNLMAMAKKALSKLGNCGNITSGTENIDGNSGFLVSGVKCTGGTDVYVAVYPIDYFFDKPGQGLLSNTLVMITSTWGSEATKCLMNSIQIKL